MSRTAIAGSAAALLVILVVLLAGYRLMKHALEPETAAWPAVTAETPRPVHPGHLYGVVTTIEGSDHQGYLRFGGAQEAFWSDAFNGFKPHNPWAEHLPEQAGAPKPSDLERPFMTRFGNLQRIDVEGRDVRVTLKSGTTVRLDRHEAGDIDDGVRVWVDDTRVVDVEARAIRRIEFRPAPGAAAPLSRLHGVVRTASGSFSGFLQWNRLKRLSSDTLIGRNDDGPQALPFADIAVIERDADSGCRVRLRSGEEVMLRGEPDVNRRNRGLVVDDSRYGRVLIPWDRVEHVTLTAAVDSPSYPDFEPGRAIHGSVETRQGDVSGGRLVFDLDESETTDTLDAPADGVTYTIPFSRIRSVARDPSSDTPFVVQLDSGPLRLEARGDLAEGNGGMLVFPESGGPAAYVPWQEVLRIDLAAASSGPAPGSDGENVD